MEASSCHGSTATRYQATRQWRSSACALPFDPLSLPPLPALPFLPLPFLFAFPFQLVDGLPTCMPFPTLVLPVSLACVHCTRMPNARSRWYSPARAWKRTPQAPVANTRAGVQMIEQHNASARKTFYDSGTCIYWFTQHRMQM